jgi:hypothetical protein
MGEHLNAYKLDHVMNITDAARGAADRTDVREVIDAWATYTS